MNLNRAYRIAANTAGAVARALQKLKTAVQVAFERAIVTRNPAGQEGAVRRSISSTVTTLSSYVMTGTVNAWRTAGSGYRPSLRKLTLPVLLALGRMETISVKRFHELADEALSRITTETREDVLREIVREFVARGILRITDSLGREYDAVEWTERAVDTAILNAARQAYTGTLLAKGSTVVKVITEQGACGKCRPFHNRHLALRPTPGMFTVAQAERLGLFHPSCRCHMVEIRQAVAA
ncbi:phage minor capsid protein [Gordonia sp. w5E2]|uniref:Phage head morphogenesis domain-containing protein n=1 Tax=Gordonia jacobaea TaxID=122202 RepID=A0ABR5IG96_9ACTN|nr:MULTISPECIES: phage minor capsid protein [Gordonia]KNA92729.1 hypothetical protein ABW18_05550 [Gordonia jacobaea]